MSGRSETLDQLRRNVAEQSFTDDQVRAFMKMTVYQRLDGQLERWGNRLSDLTLDAAFEEVVMLKDAEIERVRSVVLEKELAALEHEVEDLRFRVAYARSFRYLIKTFIIRVMEKFRLRRPPA